MLDILPGFGRRTLVLGALNATDDSFSGDGYGGDVAALVRCGVEMARDGADALDVGAASSRPGHGEVPLAQELGRARSAVAGLCAAVDLPISVDSTRAEVVSACLEAGARIVNDVSCLSDQRLAAVAAARGAALIVVHTL
ncbi:MAG: dihydropteroate synthase, partial [Chloroflexi bacterium]|nr:dihydropteroate synthase [Chloroflexota bacterium]